jgi:hypothetical protein
MFQKIGHTNSLDASKTKEELIHELALKKAALVEAENKYQTVINAQSEGIIYQLADGSIAIRAQNVFLD